MGYLSPINDSNKWAIYLKKMKSKPIINLPISASMIQGLKRGDSPQ